MAPPKPDPSGAGTCSPSPATRIGRPASNLGTLTTLFLIGTSFFLSDLTFLTTARLDPPTTVPPTTAAMVPPFAATSLQFYNSSDIIGFQSFVIDPGDIIGIDFDSSDANIIGIDFDSSDAIGFLVRSDSSEVIGF